MSITNADRRIVMQTAWSFSRAEPARAFADCLRGAWRWFKGMAASAAALLRRARGARRLQLSPSLIRSPIERATSTQLYAGRADWHAAAITSRLGR